MYEMKVTIIHEDENFTIHIQKNNNNNNKKKKINYREYPKVLTSLIQTVILCCLYRVLETQTVTY